ncbi:hypothetical protein ACOMHN_010222 [Nucella lapillus]
MTQSVDVVDKRVVRTGSNATFVASGTILDALTLQGALRIWRKKSGCAISAPSEPGAYCPRGGCLMPPKAANM